MGTLRKIAMLGNHLPRECGIATFTTDLSDAIATKAPEADCFVLAMNDAGRRHPYPARVRFEIAEADLAAYRRAADFLNVNAVDAVCVQHEYGIFGGKAGRYLLALLSELRMPVVTTLHTILGEPTTSQRDVMDELTRMSERLVAMTAHGASILHDVHHVPSDKRVADTKVNRPGFPGAQISWKGMGHGKTEEVRTGGARAGCTDGAGRPGRTRLTVGGDPVDRGEDRLLG